jgi:3-oxoadipate enol-lactonase
MDFIELSGGRFGYICTGQGTPVLLLHGLGSSLLDWQPQIDHLSRSFRVYALDLRGHGRSEPLRARLRLADLAEDVAEFIRAKEIEPCFVVGISMGGMIGFQLLASHPDIARGFVAINSTPSFPLDSFALRCRLALRLLLIRLLGLRALGWLLARKLFPHAGQAALRAQTAARIAGNDRTSYLHALRAIPGWSAWPALENVATPMLIVSGDRDYTPLAYKRDYVRKLRNARLVVIEDSGHATPLDQPTRLNAVLERFLADPDAALAG